MTLDAVNAVATHLGGLREGRKSILFVSQGPPVSLRSINWPRMEDVVNSANRGNVTIHTMDPRPLGSSEFGNNMVLRRFSDETGGRAIHNTNDHAEHLDEVIEDASAYSPRRLRTVARDGGRQVSQDRRRSQTAWGTRRVAPWLLRAPIRELTAPPVTPVATEVMDALTTLVAPKLGRTVDVWVGFSRGDESLTDVVVTWDPTTRTGSAAAARLDVERLRNDGTVEGPSRSVSLRRPQRHQRRRGLFSGPGKDLLRFTSYDARGEVLDRWPADISVPAIGKVRWHWRRRGFLARSAFELRKPSRVAQRLAVRHAPAS